MKLTEHSAEDWAKSFWEVGGKRLLTANEFSCFHTANVVDDALDKDALVKALESGQCGYLSALWKRVKHCHSYTVTPTLMFVLEDIVTNFAISTMLASYMQYISNKKGIKEFGPDEFVQQVLEYHLPKDWRAIWESQKTDFSLKTGFSLEKSDNILDFPEAFVSIQNR